MVVVVKQTKSKKKLTRHITINLNLNTGVLSSKGYHDYPSEPCKNGGLNETANSNNIAVTSTDDR